MEENHIDTRQERRETKLRKKKEHMQRHGAGLAKVYRDALEKRSRTGEGKEKEPK
jgi:hypothetical protein